MKVYTCELCGKQYGSSQAKWMHKHRSHPSGTIDNSDIEKRIAVIEKRMADIQSELDGLRSKHAYNINNSFSGSTSVVNISSNENLTIVHQGVAGNGDKQCNGDKQLSIEDMHPFEDDNFEEFLSVAQFQECGYSLVKLLQLSHFNPAFPEYMNFIQVPNCIEKAYVLSKDRRWVKVDFHTSLAALLWRLVHRVSKVNPVEASKYENDASFFKDGMESISMKSIYGIASHTQMCIRKLCDLGICLPGDLM